MRDTNNGTIQIEREPELASNLNAPFVRENFIPEAWNTPQEAVHLIYPDPEYVNTMAQHRQGRNPRQEDLESSIDSLGKVLNPINVAIFDEEKLLEFLEFTNRIWNKDKKIDEFKQFAPGQYLVVIAGHSRLIVVKSLNSKNSDRQIQLPAQLHEIETIDEFIGMQLAENISSPPPPARAARAFAEAYAWKRTKNPKLTQKEFADQNGITSDQLSDALKYANLPEAIRDFTDSQDLPFSISVELGKAYPWIQIDRRVELDKKYPYMGEDVKKKDIDEFAIKELMVFISRFNGRFVRQVGKTKASIRDHTKALIDKHSDSLIEQLEMSLLDARNSADQRQILMQEIEHLVRRTEIDRERTHNRIVSLLDAHEAEIDPNIRKMLHEIGVHAIKATKTTKDISEQPQLIIDN